MRMHVPTSVTHQPEVRIDLLTFMQIVNNFALEPYSNLFSFNLFTMSAKFPFVSKRPIVPGIIDLPKFNFEDLVEIVAGPWQVITYIHTTPLSLFFILYKFLVRMMIKFTITKMFLPLHGL